MDTLCQDLPHSYRRAPRLFDALALARGDGRHARMLKSLARVELVILNDWGLATLTQDQARDLLLEVIDEGRCQVASCEGR